MVSCDFEKRDSYCHPFGDGRCHLPYPSDRYRGEGLARLERLPLWPGLEPSVRDDPPAFWSLRRADGFPVRGGILIEVPCDLDPASLAGGETDPARRRNSRNLYLLEASAGGSVPFRVRYYREDYCALEIRPARPLDYGRKYILVLSGLRDGRGRRVELSGAFERIRSRPSHARQEPTRRALLDLDRYLRLPAQDVQLVLPFTTESLARPLGAVRVLVRRLLERPHLAEAVRWRPSERAGFFAEAADLLTLPSICSKYRTGRCRIVTDRAGLPRIDSRPWPLRYRLLLPEPRSARPPGVLLIAAASPARLDALFESPALLELAHRGNLILAGLEIESEGIPEIQKQLRVDALLRGALADVLFARWLRRLPPPPGWPTDRAWPAELATIGLARDERFTRFGMSINPGLAGIVVAPAATTPALIDGGTIDVYGIAWRIGDIASLAPAPERSAGFERAFFAREAALYFFDWLRPEHFPARWSRPPSLRLSDFAYDRVEPARIEATLRFIERRRGTS